MIYVANNCELTVHLQLSRCRDARPMGYVFCIGEALIVTTYMPRAALGTSATGPLLTLVDFIVKRMVLLFFPSVTLAAKALQWAALFVATYKCSALPMLAQIVRVIVEKMRLPPKILPVVSIHTLRLIVVTVERTPLRLKVIHVEVGVTRHYMNQPRFYVLVGVGKAAKVAIFAILRHFFSAEFSFIPFQMV